MTKLIIIRLFLLLILGLAGCEYRTTNDIYSEIRTLPMNHSFAIEIGNQNVAEPPDIVIEIKRIDPKLYGTKKYPYFRMRIKDWELFKKEFVDNVY